MASTLAGRRPPLLRAAVLAGAAVLPMAAFTVPAYAAPGDNGDVKIHKVGTPPSDPADESKVCDFYLAAFNFDTVQQVTWHIDQQPPTGMTPNVRTGQITLVSGTGSTDTVPRLPDGHYQLVWNFAGESGSAKHKTFTVDCSGASSSPSASPSGSSSPSASASSTPSSRPSRPPKGGVAAGAGGSSHDLNPAEMAVGTALIAGAGYLVLRRRRRSGR